MIRLRLPLDNEKMLSLRSLVLPAPIVPVIMSNDSIAPMIIEAGTMVGDRSTTYTSTAIPGGFKRPAETLDDAAKRELVEETGVDAASLLTQFGAYGDPERDPRMNVVTVAYLAVLRDVGAVAGGSDAAAAALIPVSDVLNGKVGLAFDHLRLVRDAIERVRLELEVTGIATAFVGTTFTLAELRAVYEAVWGVEIDAANFRRSVVAEEGWVIPTGRRARPGPAGGRPAELFRAGRASTRGGPIHRLHR